LNSQHELSNVAEHIISKLKEGGAAGGHPLLSAAAGNGHGGVSADAYDEALCRQPRPAKGHQAYTRLLMS
jgi:hypothetical protein